MKFKYTPPSNNLQSKLNLAGMFLDLSGLRSANFLTFAYDYSLNMMKKLIGEQSERNEKGCFAFPSERADKGFNTPGLRAEGVEPEAPASGSKIFIIFLGLALTFLIPSIVSADIIDPGMKEIDYCFQVENIKDYPEYIFLSYFQEPVGGHKVINQGDCVSFYKFSHPTIYAIKKGDFNENEIGSSDEQEKNYFQNNKKLIASGISIKSINSVKEYDPRQKIVDVYKIESVDNASLKISPLKVIYTYIDGTSEEKIYQSPPNSTETPPRPEPSKKTFLPYWFGIIWYIVLPLVALVIIITILIYRRTKK